MYGFRIRRFALTVAGLGLLLLALIPAAVGAASPYPPNTVVSTYYDARYCGGPISIVADGGGNLINVCTSTNTRIDPAAPYLAPGYNYGAAPAYGTGIYGTGNIPPFATGYLPSVTGSVGTGAINTGAVIRQYIDGNANCPNGDVTETTSGFFCTATGQPAASINGFIPAFNNSGYASYASGYGNVGYGNIGTGAVIRQYNDGRSNCSNGDVTETTSGFFCTATGQPAFRAS